jgi:hypothetical protein
MDIEKLQKDKTELEKQLKSLEVNIFRIQGAIVYINQLLDPPITDPIIGEVKTKDD